MVKSIKINWFIYVLFAIITCIILKELVFQSGQIMITKDGDGIKNIYTYLFHVLYGEGLWFEGGNYPYGEHVTYTDNQPILAVTMAYLNQHFHFDRELALSVFHLIIPLGFILGFIYTYKILELFDLPKWYSFTLSLIIIFLAPQSLRITGHFGMVYVNYIPMQFYWLYKYSKSNLKKYPYYIGFLSLIMPFFHMYFAAFTLVWVGSYSVAHFITSTDSKKIKYKHLIPLWILALITLIVVFSFVKLTDPITDRPVEPYGILNGCTKGKDIFTSQFSPIWQTILNISPEKAEMIEGSCYIGLTALIITLIITFLFLKSTIKKTSFNLPFDTNIDKKWIIMGFITLVFAMGVPFVWNMEFLYNLVPPMKQFRTLGRYSWTFYFMASIFSAVVLYQYVEHLKSKNLIQKSKLILFGGILIWAIESSGNIIKIRDVIGNGPKFYKEIFALNSDQMSLKKYLEKNQLKPDSFQAMMFIPFTHIGSEKIWIEKDKIGAESMSLLSALSLQTGLPFINQLMSRTSWSQTFHQIEMIEGEQDAYDQFCQYRFDQFNNKPILIIVPSTYTELPIYFRWHKLAGNLVGTGEYSMYKMYPNEVKLFCQNAISNVQKSKWFDKKNHQDYSDTVIQFGLQSEAKNTFYHSKHWKSSFNISKINKEFIDSFTFDSLTRPKLNVEFSIWVNVPKSNYRSSKFKIHLQKKNGKDSVLDIDTKWSTQVISSDSIWMRCGYQFSIPKGYHSMKIMVENDRGKNGYSLQNLMVREVSTIVVMSQCKSFIHHQKQYSGMLRFINNRYLYP